MDSLPCIGDLMIKKTLATFISGTICLKGLGLEIGPACKASDLQQDSNKAMQRPLILIAGIIQGARKAGKARNHSPRKAGQPRTQPAKIAADRPRWSAQRQATQRQAEVIQR